MASLSKGSTVLAVFFGGALGALLRVLTIAALPSAWNNTGIALLVVNLVGAFALGMLSVFFIPSSASTTPANTTRPANTNLPTITPPANTTRPANMNPPASTTRSASTHRLAKLFLTTGLLGAFTSFASLSSTSWILLDAHPQHDSLTLLHSTGGAVGQLYSHLDGLANGGVASAPATPNPATPNPATPNPATPNPATPNPTTPNPTMFGPAAYAMVMMFGSIALGLVAAWCGIALGRALWGGERA